VRRRGEDSGGGWLVEVGWYKGWYSTILLANTSHSFRSHFGGSLWALLHAHTVVEVCPPFTKCAGVAIRAPLTRCTLASTGCTRALALAAVLVQPSGACEGLAAFVTELFKQVRQTRRRGRGRGRGETGEVGVRREGEERERKWKRIGRAHV